MARALACLAATGASLGGCGEASSTKTVTTTRTAATTPSRLTRAHQFRLCLRRAGITLRQVYNVPERVPLIKVPADYLGALVLSNQVFDVWIATSPSDAQLAAEQLNLTLSKKLGYTAEAAGARGLVVSAGSEGSNNGGTQSDVNKVRAANGCSDTVSK